MTTFLTIGIIAVVLFMLVSAAVKIVQEYERCTRDLARRTDDAAQHSRPVGPGPSVE
jgi:hypothetical protein